MERRREQELLDTCTCRLNQLYGEWAKRHGMSYNTMVVLDCLNWREACTQKQIAQDWGIPKQTIHSIVKDLERKGYVRYGQSEGKKEKKLFLTQEGKQYAEECLKGMHELEERTMERIGVKMQKALIESCLAYVKAFEEELYREG